MGVILSTEKTSTASGDCDNPSVSHGDDGVHAYLTTVSEAAKEDPGAPFEDQAIRAAQQCQETNYAQYMRYRDQLKRVGIPLGQFDQAMKRPNLKEDQEEQTKRGRRLELYEPSPWPEPVNGVELLDEISATIKNYMVMHESDADLVALWVIHTHIFDAFTHTPRLLITAPDMECGKTVLMSHLVGNMVNRPQIVEMMSPAPFFRLANAYQPTFLIDEADVFLHNNRDLTAVINNGWEPQGGVPRCIGDEYEVTIFETYCPVAMAGISLENKLPRPTLSRCLTVRLDRATKSEAELITRFDARKHQASVREVAQRIARWTSDNREQLGTYDPNFSNTAVHRIADRWRPLQAIAEIAGGEWPSRGLRAMHRLREASTPNTALTLLASVRDVMGSEERISTAELVNRLCNMEDGAWCDFNTGEVDPQKRSIQPRQIGSLLRDYGVRPKDIRVGDGVKKGYRSIDLEPVWERYVTGGRTPSISATELHSRRGGGDTESSSATERDSVADGHGENTVDPAACSGVADSEVGDEGNQPGRRPTVLGRLKGRFNGWRRTASGND